MKKYSISVERFYKLMDPENHGTIFLNEFITAAYQEGLEFSSEELVKIFEHMATGGKPEETAKVKVYSLTFKQLHDSILVSKDENWIFHCFIKIHGVVLQRGSSYKRLFKIWREKNSRSGADRLNSKELKAGLKKLKAGLSPAEIDKIVNSFTFDGKDMGLGAADFERTVAEGAKKLEQEKSFEKLLISEWISEFNTLCDKDSIPVDKLFYENDAE